MGSRSMLRLVQHEGVVLNAQTGAVVRQIDPVSDIKFTCCSQSFMKTPGEIVSLVRIRDGKVQMICYNQEKISG